VWRALKVAPASVPSNSKGLKQTWSSFIRTKRELANNGTSFGNEPRPPSVARTPYSAVHTIMVLIFDIV
jgi:hypothetical protein